MLNEAGAAQRRPQSPVETAMTQAALLSTPAAAPRAPSWPSMSLAEAHARLTAPGAPFEMESVEVGGRTVRA